MEPVIRVRSKTVVIPSSNIDTDQIIPARFLTTTTKIGLGRQLFADWRYQSDGSPKPDFALNRPAAAGAQVLVAVISTEIADIFRGNSLKNGLLPITVDETIWQWLQGNPGAEVDIDVEARRLTLPTGVAVSFPLRPSRGTAC